MAKTVEWVATQGKACFTRARTAAGAAWTGGYLTDTLKEALIAEQVLGIIASQEDEYSASATETALLWQEAMRCAGLSNTR